MSKETKNLVYAVDFGTSNSLLGAASNTGIFDPIALDPFAKDPRIMRSILFFKNAQDVHFGQRAIQEYTLETVGGRLIRSFKRFLPAREFHGTLIGNKVWKLEELIAVFLRRLRETANTHFDQDVTQVVLGRPALFSEDPALDQLANDRLEKAAHLAGFKSVEFLPEPIAAAYRYRLEMKKEEVVLIGDFGGGTSDFTLIRLSPTPFHPSDVLAVGGTPVAGDAIDGSLMRQRVSHNFGSQVQYQVPFGKNILTMPKSLMAYLCSTAQIQLLLSRENVEFIQQLSDWVVGPDDQKMLEQLKILLEDQLGFAVFEAIEKGKIQLSETEMGEVLFNYPGISIRDQITRTDFMAYSERETTQIFSALDETLKKAGLTYADVDRVCCTGGTARAYVIRRELEKRFAVEKLDNFNYFSSIVEGLTHRGRQILSES